MTGNVAAYAVDTSVILAGLLSWHEHHSVARMCLEDALSSSEQLVVPAPALVEAYAVMTRLPAPHRLRPRDAYSLLFQSFCDSANVVTLSKREVWQLLGSSAEEGVAGGRIYDAHVLACAIKGRARHVVTFNVRDFGPLAKDLIEVRDPLSRS